MAAETRCFVTGGGGFAGRHLVALLRGNGCEVVAPPHREVDLLDAESVRAAVRDAAPAQVFHLAALASVGRSWETPAETISANQVMTVNVLDAVRHEAPEARMLIASSGEVYGAPKELPVTEQEPLLPTSPYAVSKVGSEYAAGLYEQVYGMRIVRARAFNHAGPGQSADYVVGSLAKQFAAAEVDGSRSVTVRTGDPAVARDFCDVRDVVRAYGLAVDAEPNAYNVASGRAVTVEELVATLSGVTGLRVKHEMDPALVRPADAPVIQGSAARLQEATGWEPRIGLDQTLADAVADWRLRLGG